MDKDKKIHNAFYKYEMQLNAKIHNIWLKDNKNMSTNDIRGIIMKLLMSDFGIKEICEMKDEQLLYLIHLHWKDEDDE